MSETNLTPKQIDAINTSPKDWFVCFILVIFLLPLCLTKACITRCLVEIGSSLHPSLNRALDKYN